MLDEITWPDGTPKSQNNVFTLWQQPPRKKARSSKRKKPQPTRRELMLAALSDDKSKQGAR